MKFSKVSDSLEQGLTLPMSTGEYTIPDISAKEGLALKEIMQLANEVARRVTQDGEDQAKVIEEVFTSKGYDTEEFDLIEERSLTKAVRDQMIEDGVGYSELKLAGMTAFLWHTVNDDGEQAKSYWESLGKAPKPNRAQRRTETQTRQAEGTTTKKQGSPSGTKRQGGGQKGKGKAGAGKNS